MSKFTVPDIPERERAESLDALVVWPKRPAAQVLLDEPLQWGQAEIGKMLGYQVDNGPFFVQFSCMGKTITIDDDAYKLLSALKRRPGDSFTKVILRHLNRPADTGGELLEAMEKLPPPDVDLAMLKRIERERGKRSSGRK